MSTTGQGLPHRPTVPCPSRPHHRPLPLPRPALQLTIFKRVCRKLGLQRWPYEKAIKDGSAGSGGGGGHNSQEARAYRQQQQQQRQLHEQRGTSGWLQVCAWYNWTAVPRSAS